jgi:hypothetical protein
MKTPCFLRYALHFDLLVAATLIVGLLVGILIRIFS